MQRTDGTILDLTKILIEKCPENLKPEAEALDKRAKGGEDLMDDRVDDSD